MNEREDNSIPDAEAARENSTLKALIAAIDTREVRETETRKALNAIVAALEEVRKALKGMR